MSTRGSVIRERNPSGTGGGNGNGTPNPFISSGFDGSVPGALTPPPALPRIGAAPSSGAAGRSGTGQSIGIAQVELALTKHRSTLQGIAGVISVRRGYKVTDGWLSTTPCIVVTVKSKQANAGLQVPTQLDGVLVDVAPATPREQLLALPADAKRRINLSNGLLTEEIVRKSRYEPPPHLELSAVEDAMSVYCHTSPDAGWPTLKDFLAGTTQRLTIGMYDFTAPHVRAQLADSMHAVHGNLRIVLDPKLALGAPGGGDNPKADDETEDKVKDQLESALKKRLKFAWAAVKVEGKTTSGIFPSAYHIKVAVRDGVDFWLSSGNWQSSNQPDLDPLGADREQPGILRTYNREWHAIVEHRGLAQLYEQFLEWDFEQAEPLQVGFEAERLPDLIMPVLPEDEAAVAPKYFEPKKFEFSAERPLKLQPLLSPDNYAEHALALIKSARRTLYVQNQYIKIAKANAKGFTDILDALKAAIDDEVDVRIIVRDLPDTRTQLEALQDFGFEMSHVRVLPATHTKGVIVDSSVVMIGSHNWSNDGVLYNRDASLVFYDAEIAKFYQRVFLYDWSRAKQELSFESAMPIVVGSGAESALAGSRRVRWSDVYDG
jgi:PLD-like domain